MKKLFIVVSLLSVVNFKYLFFGDENANPRLHKTTILLFIILILLAPFTYNNLSAVSKLEGYYEVFTGAGRLSDNYNWKLWDTDFKFELRYLTYPFSNSEAYIKFYSNKDTKDIGMQKILRMQESHLKYRYEKGVSGLETYLFSRESGRLWIDNTILEMVKTDNIKDGDNAQGIRADFWFPYNISGVYIFSDFSSSETGDDVHIFRLRKYFWDKHLFFGSTYMRKVYATTEGKGYNQVISFDHKLSFGRYYLALESAVSSVPSDTTIPENECNEYDFKIMDVSVPTNFAIKSEFKGLKFGSANLGYLYFIPGFEYFGKDYRNYMSDEIKDKRGLWLNFSYLLPYRAVTLTSNFYTSENQNKDKYLHLINDTTFTFIMSDNPLIQWYNEVYLEFVKGFKVKMSYTKKTETRHGMEYAHNDFFSELVVENKYAFLRTQYKLKDIGETYEKELMGIETSINLANNTKLFTRAMSCNEESSLRYFYFVEIQYRLGGNSELYLQYGPSWWGDYGELTNDDEFAAGGRMQDEIRIILKGWF